MKTIPLPPLKLLQELLEVDDTSPSGLRWKKVKIKNQRKEKDIAGYCRPPNNYWFVGIRTDKPRQYAAHRVVFYLKTGVDPASQVIDHVRGLAEPLNIRLATSSQNGANSRKWNKKTTSKFKGVFWRKDINKWRARIGVNRARINLGNFDSEIDAAKAYNEAAIKYFGEFARINLID